MFSLPGFDAVQIVGIAILAASVAFAAWQRGWIALPTLFTTSDDDNPEPAPPVQWDDVTVATNHALAAAFIVAKFAKQEGQSELQQAAANLAKQVLEPRPAVQKPKPA